MNYKRYTRKFVMMKDSDEYRESAAKGYLRIETGNNKGAIRCQVENLNTENLERPVYKLLFLGEKKESLISGTMGTLTINGSGKGENYFRFLPYDIDGKGSELMEFTSAAIVAESLDGKNQDRKLQMLLKGELWHENRKAPAKVQRSDLEDSAAADKPALRRIERSAVKTTFEGTERSDGDLIGSETAAPEKKSSVRFGEPAKKTITYNDFYNKFLVNACTHLCRTAEIFQDIEPFDEDKTLASWKRIAAVSNMPLIAPGAHYFASKYKHYIFGAKESAAEKNTELFLEYYIGIPGRNTPEEQPDGGESGFLFWQPIKGENSSYGYWIVRINGENGRITSV